MLLLERHKLLIVVFLEVHQEPRRKMKLTRKRMMMKGVHRMKLVLPEGLHK